VIIRNILAIHAIIRNTILFIIAISLTLIVLLQEGIYIEHLKFPQVSIDGLYLKLNKKLIVKISKLKIAQSKGSVKIVDIDKIVDRTKKALTYFEDITVEELIFKDNKYTLYFVDDILYITNNDYEIVLTFERKNQQINANIPLFYIKKQNISLIGDIVYDIKSSNINIYGKFDAYNIDGNFSASKILNRVELKLNSKETNSIEDIVKSFKLNDKLNSWIIDRVKTESYKVEEFSIAGDIVNGKFNIDLDSMYAKIHGKNAIVDFRKGAFPVMGTSLDVIFKRGDLIFNIKNPKYRDTHINKSTIVIKNLTDKKDPILDIKLLIYTMFDKNIHEILNAYNIKIPVYQNSGETEALVDINVNLKKQKVKFTGDFNLTKAQIKIAKVPLFIKKGVVKYKNKQVYITDTEIKDKWYYSLVDGSIDIKNKNVNLNLDIKKLNITSSGKKIIYAKNIKTDLLIDYSKPDILFKIPKLKADFIAKKSKFIMTFNDINKIKKYILNIPVDIDSGNLKVTTKNFINYDLDGKVQWNDCFLYDNNQSCQIIIPLKGKIESNNLFLNIFNEKIRYKSKNSEIKVDNINLDLDKLINKIYDENKKSGVDKAISVIGKNSNIRYKKFKLITDDYKVVIKKDTILFEGNIDNDKVYLKKEKDYLTVKAVKIKDKTLHPLINFKALQNGIYSLEQNGTVGRRMQGKIILEGGLIKKFKAYNNVVAFINTLPALITFSSPGFSNKGFKIKYGEIDYEIDKSKIKFNKISIIGESSTILGAGEIDIKTDTINLDIVIQTAREIGKVISNIPIIGYILMGDDKSIAVGLNISGKLDNPKVNTHTIKDMVSIPFKMIKRLLQAPKQLLKKDESDKSD